MHNVRTLVRNMFCGCIAVAVITSGRVRRAKRRALNSGVVTAIYFHNPNKRLFAKCIRWLSHNGYAFISDRDVIQILRGELEPPKGAVWLSFDDGFKELLHNVIPLSCQFNIPVTLFVPSGIVDGPGLFPWLHRAASADGSSRSTTSVECVVRDALTAGDVVDICRLPHVSIASHTVWHTVTANLSDEQLRFELAESRRELESLTGRTVGCFAYPEGRLNGREGRWLIECGYQLAATTEARFITPESNPYFVPRFHVGDNIWLPEAICNMLGVWRPAIEPVQHFVRSWKAAIYQFRRAHQQRRKRSEISV